MRTLIVFFTLQLVTQPLAFSSIKLIFQLLQEIRNMQQLQHKINSAGANPQDRQIQGNYMAQANVLKQRIQYIQKMINVEQTFFLSQQQELLMNRNNNAASCSASMTTNPAMMSSIKPMETNLVGESNQLSTDLGSMQLGSMGQSSSTVVASAPTAAQIQLNQLQSNNGLASAGQSRLSQWKLEPSSSQMEKPEDLESKFSRAPGVNVKPAMLQCNSWSSGGTEGWENDAYKDSNSGLLSTSAPNHNHHHQHQQQQPAFNQFGLQQVNEFEPGKPWKAPPQAMKPNESHSQSINKDQIPSYWSSTGSPSPGESLVGSFASSSTWSFPGGPGVSGASTSVTSGPTRIENPLVDEQQMNSWPNSNVISGTNREMWNRPKAKGPPPGLGQLGTNSSQAKPSGANPWSPDESAGNNPWLQPSASSYLILRNLIQVRVASI